MGGEPFDATGRIFPVAVSIVAGMFDIVENLLMLQTISGNFTTLSLQLTFYCAAFKFVLIGIVFLYFIISVPVSIKIIVKRWKKIPGWSMEKKKSMIIHG
jgi:hypothetical protein